MQVKTQSGAVPGNNEITRTAYQASQHKLVNKRRQQQEAQKDCSPPPIMRSANDPLGALFGRKQMS